MNPLVHLNKYQIKKHILVWLILLGFYSMYSSIPGTWTAKIIGSLIEDLNYMFVFYIFSLTVFPKFWIPGRFFLIVAYSIAVYFLFTVITYLNYFQIIPALGGRVFYQNYPISLLLVENIFYYSIFGSAGIASFFHRYSVYKFKLQSEKEKSVLVKELNFIKNQFNAHITFNFLNYCYSCVQSKLIETAESIALFADMLRYTLQMRPEEKVPVSDEIKNIESFINLRKLLSKEVHVEFNYKGETEGFQILPRILITFVENAFKHGICNTPSYPILIDLENNCKLVFSVTNKINTNKKKDASTYTGMNNVKQMLELYYANAYELKQEEKDGFYYTKLFIDLKADNKSSASVKPCKESTNKKYSSKHVSDLKKFSKVLTKDTAPFDQGLSALMHLNKRQIEFHILSWLLILVYLIIISPFHDAWTAKIGRQVLILLDYMFVFYSLSLFAFPKFWENKRILLALGIIIVLFTYWIFNRVIFINIIPALGGNTYYQKTTLFYFLKVTFYYFVITSAAASASFFSRYGLYRLKQQAEKEKLLLSRELSFLKDQFNSHLTFNFLSYCYNNICKESPETAESVVIFSDMLRYTLQTGPEEKVVLSKEVVYIENFINVQRLLTTKICVDFDYDDNILDKKILSRILAVFVENAFTHGVLHDPQSPITICLKGEDNQLVFTVRNKIRPPIRRKDPRKKENVEQILELYYSNNHELKRWEENGFYNVELRMGLEEKPQVSRAQLN